jgi:Ca2+-transporting ATPase
VSAPSFPDRLKSPWARPPEDVARELATDPAHGLAADEVRARRARFGENRLREIKARSAWLILVAQFKSILTLLLAIAAGVSIFFADYVEAGAVGLVLVLNGALGFYMELRATRSMEALRALGGSAATVRRDGVAQRVSAAELVPGDVVLIDAGDLITADLRLVEGSGLEADESTLTGESMAVRKSTEAVPDAAALAERSSMLYKGTAVTRGTAVAVVTATAMATELGRISALVEEADEEVTPLEKRLNKLGQGLVWVTLAVSALVFIIGFSSATEIHLLLETVIALAVATVPEGLPVIATIALARGMHRMAQRNAVAKRLSAVETLGATGVVCTDKTGTLTENRMSARVLVLAPGEQLKLDEDREIPEDARPALEIGALCNRAELHDGEDAVGDPMESALLIAARRAHLERGALLEVEPEVREEAFDPDARRMATVHKSGERYRYAIKGAPESVLALCGLDDDEVARWSAAADALARDGLRLLGLAEKYASSPDEDAYVGLTLRGLVAMMDPPREDVPGVIKGFRSAGISVVMVTGDHPVTANVIAREVGLTDDDDDVRLGDALEPGKTPAEEICATHVFARVSPAQKLELIRAHQDAGHVVAMTGDGVNDAPALKKADIGVAMGKRGTEVARDASDLVLADDRLSTVIAAVREGRIIFDNIRDFVVYLLSCNLAEVLVIGIAPVLGLGLPLTPLQILFLNLVTDVFPALALGVSEGRGDVMKRAPRPATESLVGKRQWTTIVVYGALLTAAVLGAVVFAETQLGMTSTQSQSIAFLALGFGQTLHVFNMRAASAGLFSNAVTRNRFVWGAIALSGALIVVAALAPGLSDILAVAALDARAIALIAAASIAPLILGQLLKLAGLFDHVSAPTRAQEQT